jgi:DNA-binding transcriptional regulator YiaG
MGVMRKVDTLLIDSSIFQLFKDYMQHNPKVGVSMQKFSEVTERLRELEDACSPFVVEEIRKGTKMDTLLSVAGVAERLQVDGATVRRWINLGLLDAVELPHARKRRVYRILQSVVDRGIKESRWSKSS